MIEKVYVISFMLYYNQVLHTIVLWMEHVDLGAITETATLGLYSLSGKTSYCQMSWRLEVVRLDVEMIVSLWNLSVNTATKAPFKFQSD